MPYGYTGKILHVDLTTGKMHVEQPSPDFYRRYMGGSAMGLHYLLRDMRAGTDPLGADNVLALFNGLLTGTAISGQSRMTSVAKSPLTGCIGDSQGGGFFPAELKFAGFDGIVLRGQSPRPVYLWIKDGEFELRDASHLWGRITGDVEDALHAELDDNRVEVLQIGPAGENLVRYAAIMSMSNRANGRTGLGAVMGSKKLKAIAVRGTHKPEVADKASLMELTKWGAKMVPTSDVAGLGKYGTAEVVSGQHQAGGLPTRNFTSGSFDDWEKIDGTTLYDTRLKGAENGQQDRFGRDTCYSCAVRCKRVSEVAEGPYKTDHRYGGPEYETLATFGSYCAIDDLDAIIRANALCNMYGMDTISCGATIAWAMECFEKGRIGVEDTGGLTIRYGDAAMMVKLTEMIGKREGFGALLAEGSAQAAKIIGRGTDEFLITSKGQEAPAHMPQVKRSLALVYAANPFGADHQSSEHDPSYKSYPERMAQIGLDKPQEQLALNEEIVRYAMVTQHLYSALDSINVCQFVFGPAWQLYDTVQLAQAASAVTGWNITVPELLEVGERRLNMMRAFNAREGIGRESDTLPKKFMKQPLSGGKSDGYVIDSKQFEEALNTYYRLCEWDSVTGYPTPAKLNSLGLGWLVVNGKKAPAKSATGKRPARVKVAAGRSAAAKKIVRKKPVVKKAAAKKPAAKKVVAAKKKPIARKPIAKAKSASKPKPAARKPVVKAKAAAARRPAARKTAAKSKPAARKR